MDKNQYKKIFQYYQKLSKYQGIKELLIKKFGEILADLGGNFLIILAMFELKVSKKTDRINTLLGNNQQEILIDQVENLLVLKLKKPLNDCFCEITTSPYLINYFNQFHLATTSDYQKVEINLIKNLDYYYLINQDINLLKALKERLNLDHNPNIRLNQTVKSIITIIEFIWDNLKGYFNFEFKTPQMPINNDLRLKINFLDCYFQDSQFKMIKYLKGVLLTDPINLELSEYNLFEIIKILKRYHHTTHKGYCNFGYDQLFINQGIIYLNPLVTFFLNPEIRKTNDLLITSFTNDLINLANQQFKQLIDLLTNYLKTNHLKTNHLNNYPIKPTTINPFLNQIENINATYAKYQFKKYFPQTNPISIDLNQEITYQYQIGLLFLIRISIIIYCLCLLVQLIINSYQNHIFGIPLVIWIIFLINWSEAIVVVKIYLTSKK